MYNSFDDEWDTFENDALVSQKNIIEKLNEDHILKQKLEIYSDNKITNELFENENEHESIESERDTMYMPASALNILPKKKLRPDTKYEDNKKQNHRYKHTQNHKQKINISGNNKSVLGNQYSTGKNRNKLDYKRENGENSDNSENDNEDLDYCCYIQDKLTR